MGLMIDLRTKVFLILHIKILKIFIFLAWDAYCTSVLKGAPLMIEIAMIGSLKNFSYKLEIVGKTQSLGCKSFLFIVSRLSVILKQWQKFQE